MLGVKIKCVVIVLHPCPGYSKFLVLILYWSFASVFHSITGGSIFYNTVCLFFICCFCLYLLACYVLCWSRSLYA
jgi:hypothetical protein